MSASSATTVQTTSRARRLKSTLREHQSFVLIAIAFLTFRLLLPWGFESVGPDISDYMRWGALSDSHLYPYVNYWSEYPPLLAWLVLGIYRLSTLLPAWPDDPRFWFALFFKFTMVAFDLGSLTLMYLTALRLGTRTRATRTAALFAGGFIVVYAASGWLDAVPLFFVLLTLYLALRDRWGSSAVAAAVGLLVKVTPVLMALVALRRTTNWRQAVKYIVVAGLTTLLIVAPFLITAPQYSIAFVRGIFARPSWTSIWAMLEGGYSFGAVAPVIERFSPDIVGTPVSNPLPWPLIHIAFLAIGAFIYTRRVDWRKPVNSVALAGLTINLYLLWSKGFSGQFTDYVFPFIILLMPNVRGLTYAGLLSVLWIAEWPTALLTTPDPMQPPNIFLGWMIIARTIVLVALSLEFAAVPFSKFSVSFKRIGTVVLIAGWISVIPAGIFLINDYRQTRLAEEPAAPVIDIIHNSTAGYPIVFADNRTFRRLYSSVHALAETLSLPPDKHVPEDVRVKWLADLATRGPFWLITDVSDPETTEINRQADHWVSDHACKVDTQWAGGALISRLVGAGAAPVPIAGQATFGNELTLTGARLSSRQLPAKDGLCVELNWQALGTPVADYTVFVHLVNSQGQVVAQTDMQPQGGDAPTSQWQPGNSIVDKHGLILPADLPPGEYTIRAGLYRADNQEPLLVTQADQFEPDANGVRLATITISP
jgi:hypothetical protein